MKTFGLFVAALLSGLLLCLLVDYAVLSRVLSDPDKPCEIYAVYPGGFYSLKPNIKNPCLWGAERFSVSTDANGFRINGVEAPKRPAEVIFLGDSFTFGVNGPWDETFVGMFENASKRSIVNTGVPSYSPTPYLHQYGVATAAGLLQKPHIVISAVDIGDVQDEASFWEEGATHPQRRIMPPQAASPAAAAPGPSRLRRFVDRNLVGTKLLLRYFAGAPSAERRADEPSVFDQPRFAFTWKNWDELNKLTGAFRTFQPMGVQGGIDMIREKMHKIADKVAQNGGALWLLIYPLPAQIAHADDAFDWQQFVTGLCAEIRCQGTVNAFPLFRDYARRNPTWYQDLYIVGDVHFNKMGNRIVADELLRVIPRALPAQ